MPGTRWDLMIDFVAYVVAGADVGHPCYYRIGQGHYKSFYIQSTPFSAAALLRWR